MDTTFSTSSCTDTDSPFCWICLQGAEDISEPLLRPCRCPRFAHLRCLARWQLQSAGKSEESTCRFCQQQLPDWKTSLATSQSGTKPVLPVMAIKYNGKTYKLRVKPGPDGLADFQAQVRRLLGFDITDEFNVTFQCSVPRTGERMMLSGLSSYGAATHCAAIAASQRPSATSSSNNNNSRGEPRSTSGHHHPHHRRSAPPSPAVTPQVSSRERGRAQPLRAYDGMETQPLSTSSSASGLAELTNLPTPTQEFSSFEGFGIQSALRADGWGSTARPGSCLDQGNAQTHTASPTQSRHHSSIADSSSSESPVVRSASCPLSLGAERTCVMPLASANVTGHSSYGPLGGLLQRSWFQVQKVFGRAVKK